MTEPRYEIKLHAEAALSPYIGDVLHPVGLWTCDNGVYLSKMVCPNNVLDHEASLAVQAKVQATHDALDWLADAKARTKQLIVQRATAAWTQTPFMQMHRAALLAGGPYIPLVDGYVTLTKEEAATLLSAELKQEAELHERCAALCDAIDAATTMQELRAIRDPAMHPSRWMA